MDNITIGGFTIATDDVDGAHRQRVKIQIGEDDTAGDVSTANPMPVSNAALTTLAGAVDGTEYQVDVLTITRPPTVRNGKTTVTTAATRVALGSGALLSGVTVKALAANTGIIYVGNSTVAAANGFALAAGEQVYIDADDLGAVYIDASVNGEAATYIGS